MKKIIREYWLVLILNLIIVSIYMIYLDTAFYKKLAFIALAELLFLIGMFRQLRSGTKKIISLVENKLVIKGIFKTLVFDKKDVLKIYVKKNFIAHLFSFDRIVIVTKSGKESIYTREVNISEMYLIGPFL